MNIGQLLTKNQPAATQPSKALSTSDTMKMLTTQKLADIASGTNNTNQPTDIFSPSKPFSQSDSIYRETKQKIAEMQNRQKPQAKMSPELQSRILDILNDGAPKTTPADTQNQGSSKVSGGVKSALDNLLGGKK